MPSSNTNMAMKLLIIAVACFFIVSGLTEIINYNSDSAQLGRAWDDFSSRVFGTKTNRGIEIVIAIIELIIGVFLFLDLINLLNFNAMSMVKIIIFILWAVFMVWTHFLNNFPPDSRIFLVWLRNFSLDLIILASLWLIAQEK